MTFGAPMGWPGAAPSPAAPAPTSSYASFSPPPAQPQGDVWLGVTVVGGGVVASLALLAWLAVANDRQHDEIKQDLAVSASDLGQRLTAYQQSHAAVHDTLQRHFRALDAEVATLALRRGMLPVPPTLAPATFVAAPPPPSAAPVTVYEAPFFAASEPVPVAAPAAVVLPSQVEAAVSRVLSERPLSGRATAARSAATPTVVTGPPSGMPGGTLTAWPPPLSARPTLVQPLSQRPTLVYGA